MRLPFHLAAVALFAALAIALTWPLAIHLHDGTLGAGVGDNATFIWNFWWIRTSMLADGASPFWTPMLFAPIGTSLLLHTTTLLPTVMATALLPNADALVTHNVALIVTVFLNGLCAYGAAYALTRRPAPSIAAGLTFAASPFLVARLQGHFNVLSAWGLPLLVMTLARFSRRVTIANAALVACALALLAYTDYYYFAFGAVLVAFSLLLQDRRLSIALTTPTTVRTQVLTVSLVLAALLIVGIIAIELSGGTEFSIVFLHVAARGTFNLRSALGIVSLIALVSWRWPIVRLRSTVALPWRAVAAGAAVLIVLVSPLIVEGVRSIANGDYASQTYLWRSAPPGIDVGALVLGNPFHPLYGAWSRAAYARLHIDAVESVVWLGLIPMACLAFACASARVRTQPEVRRWLLITAVFFVWALGPFLMTFGANSGVMLPQTVLRFVPLLANARVPGRAFVMVALGVSLILSLVLASARRTTLVSLAAAVLILLDYWPARQPFVTLDRPAIYETLRTLPAGPVLDLPLGIRDGFGERGHLDHRALFYQTLHDHPIAGGFVARLSPRLRKIYEDDPVFHALLTGSALPPTPIDQTFACSLRYVIVPKNAPAPTRDVVNRVFQLERLGGDDARDLYRVMGCRR